MTDGQREKAPCRALSMAVAVVALIGNGVATAGDFESVEYDSNSDQIIVTMAFDGTNPDHHFTLKWGPCRKHDQPNGQPGKNLISVDVLDDQWNDAANNHYTKTFRVSLAAALTSCRPAIVTLWTPPGFTQSLDIP